MRRLTERKRGPAKPRAELKADVFSGYLIGNLLAIIFSD
jgi:hypothetical protein